MSQGERQTKSEKEAMHSAHVRVVDCDKDMTASTHHGFMPMLLILLTLSIAPILLALSQLDDGYAPDTLCHTLVHRREEARQT